MGTYVKYGGNSGGGGGGGGIATITSDVLDVSGTTDITLAPKPEYDNGASGAIDWANGPAQSIELATNIVLTFANAESGGSYVLRILQNSSPNTLTFPAEVLWGNPGAPDISGLAHDSWILITMYCDRDGNYSASYQMGYTP